jgi:hypothetical protein
MRFYVRVAVTVWLVLVVMISAAKLVGMGMPVTIAVVYKESYGRQTEKFLWDGQVFVDLTHLSIDGLPVRAKDGRLAFPVERGEVFDIYLWDKGKTTRIIEGFSDSYAHSLRMDWLHDGRLVIGNDQDQFRELYVWDGDNMTHIGNTHSVGFPVRLANGQLVWGGEANKMILMWDGRNTFPIKQVESIEFFQLASDRSKVMWWALVDNDQDGELEGEVSFWDGTSITTVYHDFDPVFWLDASWDGRLAWISYRENYTQLQLHIWDDETTQEIPLDIHATTEAFHQQMPRWSRDGRIVIWGRESEFSPREIFVWDDGQIQQITDYERDDYRPVWTVDNRLIWVSETTDGRSQEVYLWDSQLIKSLGDTQNIAISQLENGWLKWTSSNDEVMIWKPESDKIISYSDYQIYWYEK